MKCLKLNCIADLIVSSRRKMSSKFFCCQFLLSNDSHHVNVTEMFCLFHSNNELLTSEEEAKQIKELNDAFNDEQIPTTILIVCPLVQLGLTMVKFSYWLMRHR